MIRGVAPQMRDQAAYLTLGGGAGGRSPGLHLTEELMVAVGGKPCRRLCYLCAGWTRFLTQIKDADCDPVVRIMRFMVC